MAYEIDPENNDIVIKGFEDGIADDPYTGISDMRNCNIISVPTECSVAFATSSQTLSTFTGSVVSADSGAETVTYTVYTGAPANGQAIVFSGGSLPSGIVAGTVYWIGSLNTSNTTFQLFTNGALSGALNITSTGTGTFASIDMGKPINGCKESADGGTNTYYYIVDSNGRAWTIGATGFWFFLGNTTLTNANGNGIIAWHGYLFVFRNQLIDYKASGSNRFTSSWNYGWKTLNTAAGVNNTHYAIISQQADAVIFCDGNVIGEFFQPSLTPGSPPSFGFDPSNSATYTYSGAACQISATDISQCLTELGTNVLIGGLFNSIYVWDLVNPQPSFLLFISENNIHRMITVNTNAYIFAGVRGRIYITNGSQAQLYKKMPDHLSGTIEPIYTWGDAVYHKNQLYFGVSATDSNGVAINQYGGLWAIDSTTKALRLTNKLSYATYAGIVSVLISELGSNTGTGFGIIIGWDSGASTYGIDGTTSTPYTGGQSYVSSDLIPIGTVLKPTTNGQVEFKLAVPIVSGESVQLYYRQKFSDSFTAINGGSVGNGLFNTVGIYSGVCQNIDFQQSQWLQIQAVLTSTASSPSYVRLKELRLR